MQLFMDVMKSLEGEHKSAVEEKQLVEELVKTGNTMMKKLKTLSERWQETHLFMSQNLVTIT